VSALTIPGFTHPVRELWLEDALAATGFRVGPGSRWAKRKLPRAESAGGPRGGGGGGGGGGATASTTAPAPAGGSSSHGAEEDEEALGWAEPVPDESGGSGDESPAAAAAGGQAGAGGSQEQEYGADVQRSLEFIDPSLVNYDLLEALVAHIVGRTQREGPAALLQVHTGPRGRPRVGPKASRPLMHASQGPNFRKTSYRHADSCSCLAPPTPPLAPPPSPCAARAGGTPRQARSRRRAAETPRRAPF
jgi:hypothetical protein